MSSVHMQKDGGEKEPDVKQPPVPPDQQPEIVPQKDPPEPDRPNGPPPLIA